jgi:hypothetical protein
LSKNRGGDFRRQLSHPGQRAVVGYVTSGTSVDEFYESLLESKHLDREQGTNRLQRPWRIRIKSSAALVRARNTVVREFLQMPGFPPWLFMIDTDMAWEPDALERLLLEASPERIVSGLCFAYTAGHRIIPTIYTLDEMGAMRSPLEQDPDWKLPENTMLQVDGTGAAFLCVHRRTLTRMQDWFAESSGARSENCWFREAEMILPVPDAKPPNPTVSMHWTSEDLWFCRLAADTGLEVFVHTGVKVRHRKGVWLDEDLYRSDYTAMTW